MENIDYNVKAINDIYKNAHIALQSISDILPAVSNDQLKKELKGQEETVHKECVKVYRNVQAVLAEETEKQTAEIIKAQSKGSKKATAALVCGILAMTFAALGLAVSLLDIFGIFAMLF